MNSHNRNVLITLNKYIFHIDLNAFYAVAEQIRDPKLHGLPVAIAGRRGKGIITTATYEAREYGVRSGMSSSEALRLCPDLVFVPNDHAYYSVEATIDGTMVGTAMGVIITALDGNFMVVENVVVSEQCRGQGVGKLILKELDRFALENQCTYAILVSSGFRKNAHKFYEAVGYVDDVRGFRKNYI
mgnify:CR=1 FL=1